GFKAMDALSEVSFFEKGLITMPVPCESKAQAFIDAGMSPRWCYYCCGPSDIYSNRFIAMPSSRNRIMGTLLYRHAIEGFLHWGFNFYYSQYSRYPVNPYLTTDSDGAFPSGDPFLVYPGEGGVPEDSIRHEVFTMGLQDMRVLQYLESRLGREALEAKLDALVDGERMTMAEYPRGEEKFLAMRAMIDALVRENC
ncbi:MAG: DUF4091 domain-containing protein, partial [Victivallales bacterium]|nr:DUF4091 domain-containing protein [Victivallales bacterium]